MLKIQVMLALALPAQFQHLHVVGNETLAGNLNFTSGTQSIQFANPGTTPQAMMNMFPSGTQNPDRMVIAHSPSYQDWGLRYRDTTDQFDFIGSGASRLSINLSSGYVGVGTATPSTPFHVVGTETLAGSLKFTNSYAIYPVCHILQLLLRL